MAITSPRQVSSGFFRNHLYVTLGLTTLAALVLGEARADRMWLAVAAAVLSFVGSAAWLYEAKRFGKLTLWLVAACSLAAAVMVQPTVSTTEHCTVVVVTQRRDFRLGARPGVRIDAAGHWYLNAPGMELAPLRRLADRVGARRRRASRSSSAPALRPKCPRNRSVTASWLLFVLLRWSFGLCGVLALLWMAWRTLEIPNTQSATGILYVAVIGVFIGELTGLLLSAESVFPL